jgi:hypothetical protein
MASMMASVSKCGAAEEPRFLSPDGCPSIGYIGVYLEIFLRAVRGMCRRMGVTA